MKNKHPVFFLTIDCFKFNRISRHGYDKHTTPHLDQLIQSDGVDFTQMIAGGPSTMAAFPCLFTSTYPVMYGGTRYLSEQRTSIAEVFQNSGYRTVGLSSNPYITPEFGYDRGFTVFWDSVKRTRKRDRKIELLSKVVRRDTTLWNLMRRMARTGEIRQKQGLYPPASDMIEKILTHASQQDDRPLFVWTHFMDLHYPYNIGKLDLSKFLDHPPTVAIADVLSKLMEETADFSEKEIQIINAIYDASLFYVDEQIGALFASLKKNGMFDDAIIVITADHGEELLENGRFGHGDEGKETPFPEELIHIPCIIKMPASKHTGTVCDALSSQVDIPPTILDLVGVEKPANWFGESLLPVLKEEKKNFRESAITQRGIEDSFSMSWRTNDWKMVYNAYNQEKRLFRLQDGTQSNRDFSSENPDILNALQGAVLNHLREYQDVYSQERLQGVELDDALRKQLQDLGYL